MIKKKNKLIRFDWAIKHLLRQKQNFDILEGFLSALLEDDSLRIIKLLDTEANQATESDKFNRVDILVEDANKQQIIIEVQNTRESHYLERMLYGTSKNIVENIDLGDKYDKVVKVISVSILYFNLGLGKDYLYRGKTHFKGMTTEETLKVRERVVKTDEFGNKQISFKEKKNIFPEYYLIQVERYQDVVDRAIDEWVYMLKNNEVKAEFKSKHIDKAKDKLKEMNMTETEYKSYQRFLENLAIEKDQIDTAKEEGEKIGFEKGRD
ncbi:MAG: Rpn family recombination-promoting nuclease/putative transposase, partial [Chitinophagales bacterium]